MLILAVQASDGSNTEFCIIQSKQSNSSSTLGCKNYQLNITLDDLAKNQLPRLNNTVKVSLTFLSGFHNLTTNLNFLNIAQVLMIGRDDRPRIQLEGGGIVIQNTSEVEVSRLEINGGGLYSLKIYKNLEIGKATLYQVSMITSAIQVEDICPQLTFTECHFVASMIEVKFLENGYQQSVTIKNTSFSSGDQLHTIAISKNPSQQSPTISKTEDPFYLSLELADVAFAEYTESQIHPPPSLWQDFNQNVSTDISFFDVQKVNLNVIRSKFSGHYHGNAIQVQDCLLSQFTIERSNFSSYIDGVLIFTENLGGTSINFRNTNMINNSINAGAISAPGTAAATLTIYPNNPVGVNTQVSIENCLFQGNADNVGNLQIILLHVLNNATIKSSTFTRNNGTVIGVDESKIIFSGVNVFDSNLAFQGGALSLTTAQIYLTDNTDLSFSNNNATHFGGAIYVNDPLFYLQNDQSSHVQCFYQPISNDFTGITVTFHNNSARFGGDHIYGTTINNYCKTEKSLTSSSLGKWHGIFTQLNEIMNTSFSSVSSKALRVCLCDDNGRPNCHNKESILIRRYSVYPGQEFNISAVIVGAEFGTTIGQVYAEVLPKSGHSTHKVSFEPAVQSISSNSACTPLSYSLSSSMPNETIYLAAAAIHWKHHRDIEENIMNAIHMYSKSNPHVIPFSLLTTPIVIDVILNKTCPIGFTMTGNPQKCDCFEDLKSKLNCSFVDGIGQVSRDKNNWIGRELQGNQTTMLFSDDCPYKYCKLDQVGVNLENDSDVQCYQHRSGTLCGECKKNYSLAIGSSRCLECPNGYPLSLLIFFLAAGPLLYMFIALLGLTITNGTINGLLFYANIVWINHNILFPEQDSVYMSIVVSRVFIAWLNLDFGIETPFFCGLDAYYKSLLQYVFPIYIWIIACIVVVLYKYVDVQRIQQHCSSLANYIENPVDILVTFILFSYTKLIRVTSDAFVSVTITNKLIKHVWALDGNVDFLRGKHIAIVIVALITLIVTLVYTLYIFFMGLRNYLCECKADDEAQEHGNDQHVERERRQQELEGKQDCRQFLCYPVCRRVISILKYIDMPLPIYNAHFASLTGKHRYWLGLMLLIRIILLVIFISVYRVDRPLNVLITLITALLLLIYISWWRIYTSKMKQILETVSLSNLAFICGGTLYGHLTRNDQCKAAIIIISTGMAFVQLIIIICLSFYKRKRRSTSQANSNQRLSLQGRERQDSDEQRDPLLGEGNGS